MSARTDIRNAVITALETITAFDGNVFAGRRRSIARADLPACCVYVEEETKDLASTNPTRTFLRELTLVCEIYSSDTSADYAELDTLCKAAETALLADESLGGSALETLPVSDQYEISEEGDYSGVFSESRFLVRYVD
jgi:hypothetical protein